ncbi:ribokinase [Glycomyces harbinensis]|uniref:Ribokinase n=1 Tax=Glycomyces harbinensis TaxID=58114 RepID=A0A1G7DCR9_9ACTN|nr:ribokinase [Glycomyces harbinensis]SDE49342.1 ribokinase [Glycomyces harbinensis]
MFATTPKPPRVAVVGSVNIDLVVTVDRRAAPGETVLASGYAESVGGKGYNQAVAAAKHLHTHLIGCVGADAYGELAVDGAHRRGVDVDEAARADVPTGRAFIEVDRNGENSIVVAPLANHALTAAHVSAALGRVRPAAVLAQLEIPFDAVSTAARWCEAHGSRFMLNPSPVAPLVTGIVRLADPLIVNEREAESLIAQLRPADRFEPGDPEAAALLLGKLAGSVVVTAGPRGVAFATAEEHGHVPARTVRAVDTTGAGDEFAGTLMASLAAGEPFARAVERANTAAADLVATPRSER